MSAKDDAWPVAMVKCYYCLEGSEIVIGKNNTKSVIEFAAAVDGNVMDMRPCSKCEQWMKDGIIIITIDAAKSLDKDGKMIMENDMPNPYRTGGFFVLKEQAVLEMLNGHEEMSKFVTEHRFMFMEHEAAVKVGLFKLVEKEKTDD